MATHVACKIKKKGFLNSRKKMKHTQEIKSFKINYKTIG